MDEPAGEIREKARQMDSELRQRMETAWEAVEAQTGLFRRNFGRVESQWKTDRTRVTKMDLLIGERIVRRLRECFPHDDLLSEEMAPGEGPLPRRGEFSWILDPIDGTNNYALGFPHCAISLGLLRDGLPVYGIIYDHARNSFFHGGPGEGVFENRRPVDFQPDANPEHGLIGMNSAGNPDLNQALPGVMSAWKIRALGSSALHLAYVAAGLLQGSVDFNARIWDIAAACPLCMAAGVEIRFLDGSPFPLRHFDVGMPAIRHCAGRPEVCGKLDQLLVFPG